MIYFPIDNMQRQSNWLQMRQEVLGENSLTKDRKQTFFCYNKAYEQGFVRANECRQMLIQVILF